MRRTARILTYVGVWLLCAVLVGLVLFLTSSRTVELASHDAVVSPDLSGKAVLDAGPILPDVRVDSGRVVGVDVQLGKTDAKSTDELVQRYALLASQPEGQLAKIGHAVESMAVDALVRGAVLGLVPVVVWLLIGPTRRRELAGRFQLRTGVVAVVLVVVLGIAVWQPWREPATPVGGGDWVSLQEFLGPDVPVPDELDDVQVRGDVTTSQTRRLVESAVDTYDTSKEFYAAAEEHAATLDLRVPEEGDTVVVFVSDRHDNIGMDPVARAIADAAGATAVFDGGDDTSTGSSWEAFSLDSVSAAFAGLDRWGVAGNHDHGDFVSDYMSDHGWTMLDGEVVEGPAGTTLLGVDDPRSSGLGSWRDEVGLSFAEVEERMADAACEVEGGLVTMLVHDANLGREALNRGCVQLVLGGHLHNRVGPEPTVGENGSTGYRYTTGTAGGAAYAIALGSKPKHEAEISLITYRDGHPAGIQWVDIQTNGVFEVGAYVELTYPPLTVQ